MQNRHFAVARAWWGRSKTRANCKMRDARGNHLQTATKQENYLVMHSMFKLRG